MNRKVVIRKVGGLDRLVMQDAPEPVSAAGEAKVRVLAAGAAFGDVLLRRGVGGGASPVAPGYDMVGVVEALDPAVSRVRVGERVAALPVTGGQQRFICLPQSELVAAPLGAAPEKAVTVVLNHLAANRLLTRAAGLKTGEAAFIYGLAGELGSTMREVAKVLGVELFGTASGGRLDQARGGGGRRLPRRSALDRGGPGGPPRRVRRRFEPSGRPALNGPFACSRPAGRP